MPEKLFCWKPHLMLDSHKYSYQLLARPYNRWFGVVFPAQWNFPSVYKLLFNLSRTPSSWEYSMIPHQLILIGLRQTAGPIRVPHPQQRMWMKLLQSQSGLISWIELTILEVMVHLPYSGSQPAKSEIWSRCATAKRCNMKKRVLPKFPITFQLMFPILSCTSTFVSD